MTRTKQLKPRHISSSSSPSSLLFPDTTMVSSCNTDAAVSASSNDFTSPHDLSPSAEGEAETSVFDSDFYKSMSPAKSPELPHPMIDGGCCNGDNIIAVSPIHDVDDERESSKGGSCDDSVLQQEVETKISCPDVEISTPTEVDEASISSDGPTIAKQKQSIWSPAAAVEATPMEEGGENSSEAETSPGLKVNDKIGEDNHLLSPDVLTKAINAASPLKLNHHQHHQKSASKYQSFIKTSKSSPELGAAPKIEPSSSSSLWHDPHFLQQIMEYSSAFGATNNSSPPSTTAAPSNWLKAWYDSIWLSHLQQQQQSQHPNLAFFNPLSSYQGGGNVTSSSPSPAFEFLRQQKCTASEDEPDPIDIATRNMALSTFWQGYLNKAAYPQNLRGSHSNPNVSMESSPRLSPSSGGGRSESVSRQLSPNNTPLGSPPSCTASPGHPGGRVLGGHHHLHSADFHLHEHQNALGKMLNHHQRVQQQARSYGDLFSHHGIMGSGGMSGSVDQHEKKEGGKIMTTKKTGNKRRTSKFFDADGGSNSIHAAIVQKVKEQFKGLDPENMYIQCPICQKRIKRLYHFQRHMRIHSGEKTHQCPFCSYKSVRKDNLKSHMKTHEKAASAASVQGSSIRSSSSSSSEAAKKLPKQNGSHQHPHDACGTHKRSLKERSGVGSRHDGNPAPIDLSATARSVLSAAGLHRRSVTPPSGGANKLFPWLPGLPTATAAAAAGDIQQLPQHLFGGMLPISPASVLQHQSSILLDKQFDPSSMISLSPDFSSKQPPTSSSYDHHNTSSPLPLQTFDFKDAHLLNPEYGIASGQLPLITGMANAVSRR